MERKTVKGNKFFARITFIGFANCQCHPKVCEQPNHPLLYSRVSIFMSQKAINLPPTTKSKETLCEKHISLKFLTTASSSFGSVEVALTRSFVKFLDCRLRSIQLDKALRVPLASPISPSWDFVVSGLCHTRTTSVSNLSGKSHSARKECSRRCKSPMARWRSPFNSWPSAHILNNVDSTARPIRCKRSNFGRHTSSTATACASHIRCSSKRSRYTSRVRREGKVPDETNGVSLWVSMESWSV